MHATWLTTVCLLYNYVSDAKTISATIGSSLVPDEKSEKSFSCLSELHVDWLIVSSTQIFIALFNVEFAA